MEKHYKTELHVHSKPVSSCSEIETKHLVNIYKENGYDGIVLTNHFTPELLGDTIDDKIKWYLEDYYNCVKEGKAVGLNVILGAELRFTQNHNDYLIFGICPEELFDIFKRLPDGIDKFYSEYKNDRNVIIQAHPYRDGMEKVDKNSLDGIEVFNLHPGHNSRLGVSAKYAKENNMIATCGSDFHHYGQECLCGILTKKPLLDSYDVAEVLKKREYLMSIGGYTVSL